MKFEEGIKIVNLCFKVFHLLHSWNFMLDSYELLGYYLHMSLLVNAFSSKKVNNLQ